MLDATATCGQPPTSQRLNTRSNQHQVPSTTSSKSSHTHPLPLNKPTRKPPTSCIICCVLFFAPRCLGNTLTAYCAPVAVSVPHTTRAAVPVPSSSPRRYLGGGAVRCCCCTALSAKATLQIGCAIGVCCTLGAAMALLGVDTALRGDLRLPFCSA